MSEATTQRTGGRILVDCLREQGVEMAFCVPGESYLAVLDGFHAHRDKIRFIINRQEGGAAYMADAQARVTGRPGVCFVTRGPGATNASIGVHTAFQDSTPLVLFVGDVGSDCRDREAFQEVDYAAGVRRGINRPHEPPPRATVPHPCRREADHPAPIIRSRPSPFNHFARSPQMYQLG